MIAKEKGISLTKDGFLVRVYRAGKTISQHVAFGQYSSQQLAFEAAIRLRDGLRAIHPEHPRAGRKPSIGYTFDRGGGQFGKKYPCWQVVYYVNVSGRVIRKTKRFYIHKYDDPDQAKLDAHQFAEKHSS